jgi:hypothetical protein
MCSALHWSGRVEDGRAGRQHEHKVCKGVTSGAAALGKILLLGQKLGDFSRANKRCSRAVPFQVLHMGQGLP